MKINYTEDGLEDLTGYMYNYKSNTFAKDGDEYKFIMACVFCGQAFMGELDGLISFVIEIVEVHLFFIIV